MTDTVFSAGLHTAVGSEIVSADAADAAEEEEEEAVAALLLCAFFPHPPMLKERLRERERRENGF